MRRTVACLSLALTLTVAGCQAELANGLAEREADEVVLALDAAGIGARKVHDDTLGDSSYRVEVADGDLVSAMSVLRERGLPRQPAPGLEALFGSGGLVPSASEERARLAAAMSGELSRSLEAIEGVVAARVHVAPPQPGTRALDDAPGSARASVLLTVRAGALVDADSARALVAGAVPGLAREDVAVVLDERAPPDTQPPRLARVGPFAVSRGTAGALKGVLGGSFALNLILAGALVISRRRTIQSRSSSPAAGEPAGSVENS